MTYLMQLETPLFGWFFPHSPLDS